MVELIREIRKLLSVVIGIFKRKPVQAPREPDDVSEPYQGDETEIRGDVTILVDKALKEKMLKRARKL